MIPLQPHCSYLTRASSMPYTCYLWVTTRPKKCRFTSRQREEMHSALRDHRSVGRWASCAHAGTADNFGFAYSVMDWKGRLS